MSAEVGRVFDIQKFSLHDGPGIRSVVFLKGCPMTCAWCSNPGSQKLRVLQVRDPLHPGVRVPDSRDWTVEEVVETCLQDRPFYQESGGGVTLSGGEALVQHRFARTLLHALRQEGVHTALETTGYAAPAVFQRVLAEVDLLLIDVKHHDPELHRRWTGVGNDLPLANLAAALAAGTPLLVRIPVIPGVNDSLADAAAFCRLLKPLGVTELQLLPFHQFGERKYELLDRGYAMAGVPALHAEDLDDYRQAFADGGIHAFC
ncbi:MAG: glycyl-radical enzyme activating protein [Propionicimonas sp.]|nr:glycyl-radical enzyme activating protein [Propionicimonas sp.]